MEGDDEEVGLGVGRREFDALLDCVKVDAGELEALTVTERD